MTAFELRPVPPELAERYLAEGAWDDRTLGEFLRDALLEDPTRRFRIWSPTHPYLGTVGEVYEESLRVAGGLRALGLGPGDVVAFQLPNWVDAAITFYACSMLGVTLVPIVHFYGPKELGFILRQSGARALVIVSSIGQRDYLADLATVREGLESLEQVVVVGDIAGDASGYVRFDDLRRAEPIDGPAHVDPDGAAVIGYTSGTTADPKGVVHTHRTLGCEVRQLSDHQAMRDLPSLVGAPVGHAIGMLGGLLCPLYSGRPIYMIDGWDPPTVLDAMVEEAREEVRGAHAVRRARGLAHSQRGGGAGGRARDFAGALVRVHRAPIDHGFTARRPQGQADPHGRPADGRGRDPHRRRGRSRRRGGRAR
jgi:acyl-CoA synthetase